MNFDAEIASVSFFLMWMLAVVHAKIISKEYQMFAEGRTILVQH